MLSQLAERRQSIRQTLLRAHGAATPPKLIKPETGDSATIWGKIRSSGDLTVNVPVSPRAPGSQSHAEHVEGQVSLLASAWGDQGPCLPADVAFSKERAEASGQRD